MVPGVGQLEFRLTSVGHAPGLAPARMEKTTCLILLVAGCSLLPGLSAQLALPLRFSPVPVTARTLAVLLGGALLGRTCGTAGVLLYLRSPGMRPSICWVCPSAGKRSGLSSARLEFKGPRFSRAGRRHSGSR